MKKATMYLGTLIIICVVVTLCSNAYPINAGERYKCFAELYSIQAKAYKISALGDSLIDKDIEYRVIAEAAHQTKHKWFQFVDTTPLDGRADITMEIWICPQYHVHTNTETNIQSVIKNITNYCIDNGHNINDVLHYAPGINRMFVEDNFNTIELKQIPKQKINADLPVLQVKYPGTVNVLTS